VPAELSFRSGDYEQARKLLDEAEVVADASGAHGIRRWITEARTELAESPQ
jgi:hypothetical protein